MPRRPGKARAPAPAPAPTDLARSRPTDRAAALGIERGRLLKEVARRRKELERTAADIEATRSAMVAELGPLIDQQARLDREIHEIFSALLAPGRLTKRQRAQVRNVYVGMQASGMLSEREPEGPAPAVPGDDGDEESFDDGPGGEPHFRDDEPPPVSHSAKKPRGGDEHRALRTLFKRLVVALHPDRAQEADEKARRTAAMKDVTRAYEAGDLARMIELGERFAGGSAFATSVDDPALIVEMLERTVTGLKRQLREVLDELRRLRRSDVFRAAKQTERLRKAGEDPFAVLRAEEQESLDDLVAARDFVAAFDAGKMSFDEFLEGPSFPSDASDEAMADVFEQMLDELQRADTRSRRGGRKKRTR